MKTGSEKMKKFSVWIGDGDFCEYVAEDEDAALLMALCEGDPRATIDDLDRSGARKSASGRWGYVYSRDGADIATVIEGSPSPTATTAYSATRA